VGAQSAPDLVDLVIGTSGDQKTGNSPLIDTDNSDPERAN
jgi:hypothetical protein